MSTNSLATAIDADHSTFNLVRGDQVTNYIYSSAAVENANPKPELLRRINDAPVDLLWVNFTGREKELDFLKETLRKGRDNLPSRCAVYGMPGIGKTQLLLRFAKMVFELRLYSHIFWTSADSVDKLNQGFAKILDLVDHRDRHLQEQNVKLTSARLWFEGSHVDDRVNWLLILDNVQGDALGFLRSHLPRSNSRGSILFTTRTVEVARASATAAGNQYPILQLQTLDSRDATSLLIGDAGIDSANVTLHQAEELVKRIGGLPLAVVHAGSFMKETGTTLGDMLELYDNGYKMEVIQWENDLTPYEERSVAATFTNQFNQLNHESGDVSNLLKVISFLDPEDIPLELIIDGAKRSLRLQEERQHASRSTTLSASSSTSSSLQPPLSPTNITSHCRISSEYQSLISLILSPIKFQKAIKKLHSLSLVEHRSRIGDSSLWMHDLIPFMMRESTRAEQTHQDWLQLSVSLVCHAFERIEDPTLSQSWAECEKFIPHLRSLNQEWKDVYGMNAELTEAMARIATYLLSRGRHDEAEVLCTWTLQVREKYMADHPDTLKSMGSLAYLYWVQGRYDEAEVFYKRALDGQKNHFRPDHLDTLMSIYGLAVVYQWKGRYDEAEKLHRRALAGREKLLGADHLHTLSSMYYLGHLCWLRGRYDEAGALHKQALAGREKQLEADHPEILWSINGLALVYWSQERYDEAERLHKHVLASNGKSLGDDHPDTLVSVNNLARVYCSQGRYDEAEALQKRALAGREKCLGADHLRTLKSSNNLAWIYWLQGRWDEAGALYERSLAIMVQHLMPDHPDRLDAMNNLALVYQSQGRCDEAATLYENALVGRKQCLGDDHPQTRETEKNLASLRRLQRGHSETDESEGKETVNAGREFAIG